MASNGNTTTTSNTGGPSPAAAAASSGGNGNGNGATASSAPTNHPCPTAQSLSQEEYDEIRSIAEEMLAMLPPGSYYTLTDDPETGKHKVTFMAREPGDCPPNCQHCRDEIALYGIPPLNPNGYYGNQGN